MCPGENVTFASEQTHGADFGGELFVGVFVEAEAEAGGVDFGVD